MSIKEIKEAIEKESVCFGIRQALRCGNGKKKCRVFVCKDARAGTLEKLDNAKIKYTALKSKSELRKELNLDFESEVFCLK